MDTKVVEDGKQIEADELKKKGMALIIHDFKQKPLIPVKILFFVMFSSKFEFKILVFIFVITAIINRYRSIGALFNYSHEVARNNGRRDCHHLRYRASVWPHRSFNDGNGR